MSTTQDAPADTRSEAQRDYERCVTRWDFIGPTHDPNDPVYAAAQVALAVHAEVEELRESKATIALVQELAEALALQADELKALRGQVDRLITHASGVEPETAPAESIVWCPVCHGRGKVWHEGSVAQFFERCPACQGSGVVAPAPTPTIESLIAEIEAGGWDWSISGYTVSGNRQVHIYDPDDAKFIAIGISDDSAISALQKALDKARQAVS